MTETTDFIPNHLLAQFGCTNCVWKQHRLCPEGLTEPDQKVPDGICEDMIQFLVNLRETSTSVSQVKEKYFIYTQELQAQDDKTKFHELLRKYEDFKKEDPNHPELAELQMAAEAVKLWWARLTTAVVKSHSRIADREGRKEEKKLIPDHITIQQFNMLIREADAPLLEGNDG